MENTGNPFTARGNWYRANLHSHTTNSDGQIRPDQAVEWYRDRGYQILAVTDHWKVTDTSGLQRPGFLTIRGAELNAGRTENGNDFHVVALGIDNTEGFKKEMTLNQCIETARSKGGLAFVAHPYWSALTTNDLKDVKGSIGIEVFNFGCELEIAKGISSVHWDDILIRGERAWGIAVDDGHKFGWDLCGGWTMIKAEKLDEKTILNALKNGDFYSSTGPGIEDLRLDGNTIYVRCSPAAQVRFVSNHQNGWCIQKWSRPPITEAQYRLGGKERYMRVEVIDETGLIAWSRPWYFGT